MVLGGEGLLGGAVLSTVISLQEVLGSIPSRVSLHVLPVSARAHTVQDMQVTVC